MTVNNLGFYWDIENIKLSSRADEIETFLSAEDDATVFKLGKSFVDSGEFIDTAFVASAYGAYIYDGFFNPLYPLEHQLREWARTELMQEPWSDVTGTLYANYRIAIDILFNTGYEEQDLVVAMRLLQIEGFYNNTSEKFLKAMSNHVAYSAATKADAAAYYLKMHKHRLTIDNVYNLSKYGGEELRQVFDTILDATSKKAVEAQLGLKLHHDLSGTKAEILFSGIWSEDPSFSKHFKARTSEFIALYDQAEQRDDFASLPMKKKDYKIDQLREDLEFFTALDGVISTLQNAEVSKAKKMEAYDWVANHPVFSSLKDRFSTQHYRLTFTKDVTPFLMRQFLIIHQYHYNNFCALYKDLKALIKSWELEAVDLELVNELKAVKEEAKPILNVLIEERLEDQLPILYSPAD